jgi:hypothetical protein
MINTTSAESKIRTVKQGDSGWLIQDGLVVAGRAGFEITRQCPYEYKLILQDAINKGWINPVASVYDHELMWEQLSD